MNISVEDLSPCRKLLRVEVPADEVNQVFDTVTAEFQKQGKIQGFRPGKAPKAMILQAYGSSINDGVKDDLIRKSFRKAVADNSLEVIEHMNLEAQKLSRNEPFDYTVTVEVLPKFEVPEVKGIPVKVPARTVTDEDISRALDQLRSEKATYNTADRPSQMGDIVVIDYTGTVDDKPLSEVAASARSLGGQENFWLELKTGAFIPGFVEQLVGTKAGDAREFDVTFPAGFIVPEISGKKGSYKVSVKEVKSKELPPLDDAFAKTFEAENVDALNAGVRRDLEADLKRKRHETIRSQIVEFLLKEIQIALPESLLQSQTKSEVYDIVYENQKRGVDAKTIEEHKDSIFNSASSTAANRLRMNIILNRIAVKEKVNVTPEEFQTQLAYMAHQNKTPIIPFIRDLEKKGHLSQIKENMLLDKTLGYLTKNAKIEEVAEPAPGSTA